MNDKEILRKPRTVQELAQDANSYEFSTYVSFRSWIHVAKSLLQEARIYADEGQFENAYTMYARYANLILNSMPQHPDLKVYSKEFSKLTGKVEQVLETMEKLKDLINQQLESYKLELKKREQKIERARIKREQQQQNATTAPRSRTDRQPPKPPTDTNFDTDFMNTLTTLRRLQKPTTTTTTNTTNNSHESTTKNEKPPTWSYPIPPNQATIRQFNYDGPPPPLPEKPYTKHSSSQLSIASVPSKIDTTTTAKQEPKDHQPRAYTEDGIALRTIVIPSQLRKRFLSIAEPNTRRNLETCGILCGKLHRNAFFVTHLVIPHQTATSDTCSTENEELLFEYVDKNDLFILGWIHTHPSQTCFLSSIDLHTQSSYQLMLNEAVAIVCSPSHTPSWGVFRLTDPPGIPTLKKCRITTSTFHPHPEPNLYVPAYNPGHVLFTEQMDKNSFHVQDLRTL